MSTEPPQANATITLVRGAGVADDWDQPGGVGAPKFAGEIRAYYRATTTRAAAPGAPPATAILTKRELIVTMDALDEIGLDTDDVITFRLDGADTDATGTAQAIPYRRLAGIPASLQTSRVRLEDV